MKNTLAILCLAGSTIALSACTDGMGNVDTAPPYTMSRTAIHTQEAVYVAPAEEVAPAEPVFQRAQTK